MNSPRVPPDLPQPGDTLAGKYELEKVLGAGGMGVVLAARHLVLGQRVAIKLLLPAATRLPQATARFLREARAAVAIRSEHVARVLDSGTLDNGAPYLVMEHLVGTDFAHLLRERGRLSVVEALEYLLQACEALAEAHTLGIVHRDLKPGNLFLTSRAEGSPLVKVLDFGLSKVLQEEADIEGSLTATGVIAGSPHYMSPEQVRSLKHVDARTDIWALGVILYELLTGERPFKGQTATAICVSIAADNPPPPRALRPELATALEAAVLACLEKDRERRTQTVAEFVRQLAPFAPPSALILVERISRLQPVPAANPAPATKTDMPAIATVPLSQLTPETAAVPTERLPMPPPGTVPTPVPTTGHAGVWDRSARQASRRPLALVASGTLIIGAVAVAAWIALGRWNTGEPAAAAGASSPPPATTSSSPAGLPSAAETRPLESITPAVQPTASSPAAAEIPSARGMNVPASAPAPKNSFPPAPAVRPAPTSVPRPTSKPARLRFPANPLDRPD